MMRRLVSLSLAALCILLLTAACGGDDDSPGATDTTAATATATGTDSAASTSTPGEASAELEDYFAGMQDIATRTEGRLNDISDRLDSSNFDNEGDEIAANQEGLQQSGEAVETALLDMSGLNPPSEVKDAHDRFFQALNSVLQLYAALAEDIADVATMDELNGVADTYGAEFTDANSEFDQSCSALQALADGHDIAVDLRCSD